MASNQSAHFQLNLWEPGDDFLRTEFNANFTKLDQAARVVAGTYTGNGDASKLIDLGFQPKAVLLASASGDMRDNYYCYGGLALPGYPVRLNDSLVSLSVEETGFRVYYLSNNGTSWKLFTNSSGSMFHYLAFY